MLTVTRVKVAVLDPSPLVRVGLTSVIGGTPEFEVIAEGGEVDELAERGADVDVVISDVATGTKSGPALVAQLKTSAPDCKVLVFSMVKNPKVIGWMLAAGAAGYALKTDPIDELVAALRRVARGELYVPPRLGAPAAAAASQSFDGLTKREREVFELIVRGYSNAEIATRLFISRRTAETHRHRINKKLGTAAITEAIASAELA